ncbi:MAG: T9SS type A sorting domain-containing protein [Phycisphaerae bacterium]|nr:T9SS type A sorting domain-containing protein [Saprospiraceae bacterium]
MRLFFTFLLSFFFLTFNALQAQVSKDVTVPLSATITIGPASVILNWPNTGNAGLLVRRRTKGQGNTAWQQILNVSNSNLTSLTDNNLTAGQIYEYSILRIINGLNAYGFAHVAINANPVDSRGKILIFVDSTTADALGVELVRLKNDMRGDGWWPIPFHTGPSSTVQSIKSQIITSYNADPTNVKAVLLLGTVPIPYSGNAAWDGHPDHQGAWPSDAYYADVNGNWTDVSVSNITPGRDANKNIPGDGKFDQIYLPSVAELQIGRVDFRHINAAAFGAADQIALMKRYLDKDHNWRIGDYTVENKALVDDNFGYFGGEAFGSNGFRNAYPLVGEANIVETDFFDGTETQSYLLGYGCGGGNYNGAGGVGSSSNFATDSINIVFSNLFGSYFGDWDYESDPFMPSALASRGGILTCSWAGRPHWFNQALASGETIGYCNKETMNAQLNAAYPPSSGKGGAHVALLGDPTLRAHILKPATNLTLSSLNCQSVELSWTASADTVAGYHIYRAPAQDGPYTRLTTTPVASTTYTDNSPVQGTLFYQVRAIRNVTSPGGGTYANNAIGPIKSIEYVQLPLLSTFEAPLVDCDGSFSICANPSGGTAPYTYLWSNSSTANCATFNGSNTIGVTVSDAIGCSFQNTQTVNAAPPLSDPVFTFTDNCNGGYVICLSVTGGSPPYMIAWTDGGTSDCTTVGGGIVSEIGATVTDEAGCTVVVPNFIVNHPAPPPTLSTTIMNESAPNAHDGSITLFVNPSFPSYQYLWSNGATTKDISGLAGGIYTCTVTSPSGCTKAISATVTTTSDTEESVLFQQLQLSPNPNKGFALLSLKLHQSATLRVEIRDWAGRLIWENPIVETDALNLPIDLTQSPAGMYTVAIWVENQVFVRKLTVVR